MSGIIIPNALTSLTPLTLVLATASAWPSLAVAAASGQCLAFAALETQRRLGADLVPAIGRLLAALSVRPEQIDQVVVDRGPGSFTGIRTGISAAQGFAFAHNKPVYSLTHLQAAAARVAALDAKIESVHVLLPDGAGQFFYQVFKAQDNGLPKAEMEPELVSEVPSVVPTAETMLTGSGWLAEDAFACHVLAADPVLADELGRIAVTAGITALTDALEPLYIKPCYAKVPSP